MKIYLALIALGLSCLFCSPVYAQEECRQVSDLPIQIGGSIICGQVKIRGLGSDDTQPSIRVTFLINGLAIERTRPNSVGYYFFRRAATNNASLLFEVNEMEVGRIALMETSKGATRHDIELDMSMFRNNPQAVPGVVSIHNMYSRQPDDQKVFTQAMSDIKANRKDQAISGLKKIVAKDPNDFVAWLELAGLYFDSNPKEAREAYQKALAAKPDFFFALLNFGKFELAQKNYEPSIEILHRAVTLDGTSADANHYLGEAYLGAKKGSKAVGYLNEAIRLSPVAKAEIHFRLAALYHAANLRSRAAEEYRLFLEKVPTYAEKTKLEEYIVQNTPK